MRDMNKKKVLLVMPHDSSCLPGFTRAFNYLGWETRSFDYRKLNILEKATRVVFPKSNYYSDLMNIRLRKAIRDFRPQIFFTQKADGISAETVDFARKLKCITVDSFPDDLQNWDLELETSKYYDFFFHFDPYAISLLKKEGRTKVYYLPYAADILPTDAEISFSRHREFPLTFVGNYYPIREKYFRQIKNTGLKLWGGEKWAQTSLAEKYQGKLPFTDLGKVLKESNMSLNIQFESPCTGIVLRAFEIISAGAMLIQDNRPESKKLFRDGKDFVYINNPSELEQRVNYYLKHETERLKIARSGYKIVRSKHTNVHRLQYILKLLK